MNSLRSELSLRARYYARRIHRPSEFTLRGVKLRFPSNISSTLRDALYREDYEANELHALDALLRPGDRVLEIGSSVGFLTISACQRVGAENVVAIEANPAIAAYARKNFDLNGVSPTLHIGLADADASENRRAFYVYDDFWSSSEFSRSNRSDEQRIECDVIPVNKIITDHKANVMICDIEGGEIALLPKLHLHKLKTLIIEFHPQISSAENIRRSISHILEAGFSIDLPASTGDTLAFTHI
jgi:FkbM family methyltransferase